MFFVVVLLCFGIVATFVILFFQPRIDSWWIWRFLVAERNPALQLVYASLIFGVFHLALKHALPFLHWGYTAGGWAVVVGCVASLIWAIFTEPTIITRHNVKRLKKQWRPDGIVFPLETRQCSTCNIEKPARSKHCATCDHCVHEFDHHCIWLNVCIGSKNKRAFMVFLLATIIACFYCAYVMALVLYRMGPPASMREYVLIVMYRGGIVTAMLALTAVLGVTLTAFFSFHLWLVMRGETHNEHAKRGKYAEAARITNTKVDLRNPYNRGALPNLMHMMFPKH